jgi:hypothetical protein
LISRRFQRKSSTVTTSTPVTDKGLLRKDLSDVKAIRRG